MKRGLGRFSTLSAGLLLAAAGAVPTSPMAAAGGAEASASAAPVGGAVTTVALHGASPAVVVDRAGTATLVWSRTGWPGGVIRASRHRAGGHWTTPVRIGVGADPQIGVDAQGAVTVVWQSNRDGFTAGVMAARRPPKGPWRAPVRLSNDVAANYHPSADQDEGTYGAGTPDLAVTPGGAALVAWSWGSSDRDVPFRIQSAYRPAAGPWQELVQLTPADWSSRPSVGVAREGRGVVAYESPNDGPIAGRLRFATGRWTPAERLYSSETDAHQVVMDPAGNATLLLDTYTAVLSRRHRLGAAWTPVVRVADGSLAQAVIDPAGAVSVTAVHRGRLSSARRPPAGPWAPPVFIGSTDAAYDVSLSASFTRHLLVAWPNPTTSLMGRSWAPAAGWSAPFQVLGPGGTIWDVASAASSGGGGVVAWQKNWSKIQVRVYR